MRARLMLLRNIMLQNLGRERDVPPLALQALQEAGTQWQGVVLPHCVQARQPCKEAIGTAGVLRQGCDSSRCNGHLLLCRRECLRPLRPCQHTSAAVCAGECKLTFSLLASRRLGMGAMAPAPDTRTARAPLPLTSGQRQ